MAKNEQQAPLDETRTLVEQPRETATKKPEYEDNDPVTVIWKSWGTAGMPRNRVTYFDKQTFEGGVGRRIPYHIAKKWLQQGHGIHILPVLPKEKEELEFMKATGHAPIQDADLESLLRATPIDKIAAMLGPENLDKITAMHKK